MQACSAEGFSCLIFSYCGSYHGRRRDRGENCYRISFQRGILIRLHPCGSARVTGLAAKERRHAKVPCIHPSSVSQTRASRAIRGGDL
ncbi:hypothetical protein AFLA_013059 [Aspergillus flavus NRRL3357]|nr:hypothetical protein AFLA_013059 [Aspergillus flavus NRRL3357]